jgi:hypothetical protein
MEGEGDDLGWGSSASAPQDSLKEGTRLRGCGPRISHFTFHHVMIGTEVALMGQNAIDEAFGKRGLTTTSLSLNEKEAHS